MEVKQFGHNWQGDFPGWYIAGVTSLDVEL